MLSQKYKDKYNSGLIDNYFSTIHLKDRLFTLTPMEDNLYQKNLRF